MDKSRCIRQAISIPNNKTNILIENKIRQGLVFVMLAHKLIFQAVRQGRMSYEDQRILQPFHFLLTKQRSIKRMKNYRNLDWK